jgi:hypothetical protein
VQAESTSTLSKPYCIYLNSSPELSHGLLAQPS